MLTRHLQTRNASDKFLNQWNFYISMVDFEKWPKSQFLPKKGGLFDFSLAKMKIFSAF